MPYKDGTGPLNQGPKTGRQMGNCVSENNPETPRPRWGRQERCPNNRRQRRCMGDFANPSVNQEKEKLEQKVANLESALNDLKMRLHRFENIED